MKRSFTCILCVFVLLLSAFAFPCLSPLSVHAEQEDSIVVIAASDFQGETDEESANTLRALLNSVKAGGYENPFGFLFGGDYDLQHEDKTEKITLLKNTVSEVYPGISEDNMVLVQGNHDPASSVGLSPSGNNDTEHYGVYVLHEDEYMYSNNSLPTIKETAQKLDEYLTEKANAGYTAPVFVVSHLPLHYSARTKNVGDARYAKRIFDVLNKHGENGLNIIFLYGHNHSDHYDDYLGGCAVYLQKGDRIYISKEGKALKQPDEYVLNFTYLNAGYVGSVYCLGDTPTMTVFEITGDVVKIERYSMQGKHLLKAKGSWSAKFADNAETYGTDNDYLDLSYTSPMYVGNMAVDENVSEKSIDISDISAGENAPQDGGNTWIWISVSLAGAVLLAVIVIVIVKRKKQPF